MKHLRQLSRQPASADSQSNQELIDAKNNFVDVIVGLLPVIIAAKNPQNTTR